MRSKYFLAFTLALAIPLAACGGDDDGGDDTVTVGPDAAIGTPDGPVAEACNPVEGTGCEADEKCAFVFDSFPDLGRTACAPAGDKVLNDACTRDMTSGIDDCGAGLQCLSGFCREICSSAPDSCTTDYACSRYSAYFTDNDNVGVCDPRCNPVDQTRDYDGAELCGSVDTAEPELGCYGHFDIPFTCSPAGDPANVHNVDPRDENGTLFLNSCAPGFLPLFNRGTDDAVPICMAMCSPVETHSGDQVGAAGADPHTCGARNALAPNECRFFTVFEDNPSVDRNYVGFCLNYTNYLYDTNNDMTPDTQWPSCTTVPNTDEDANGFPDHAEWACAPFTASLVGGSPAQKLQQRLREAGYELAISPEQAVKLYEDFLNSK